MSAGLEIEAMHDDDARDQEAAGAANRRAKILTPSLPEKDDPNIAAALAAASGSGAPPASLSDRLAALKTRQGA
jgi:hypothetical protein